LKSKSLKTKYVAKRSEIDESLFGMCSFTLGIRTNLPQKNDEELKKVTQMVK
jgi:hypothetical protein